MGVWFIGPEKPNTTMPLRTLRLALLRLHIEQEALDLVLKQIRRGALPYAPRTDAGNLLEDYLNRMTDLLGRSKRFSVPQRELLRALARSGAGTANDPTELLDRLKGARRQVLKKIEDYELEREASRPVTVYSTQGGDLHVEEQHNSGTFYGPVINSVIAERIENSFNVVNNSNASDELKQALDRFTTRSRRRLPRCRRASKARPKD